MRTECWIPIDGERTALFLHPSTLHPSGWRLTRWDHVGPCGHTEHEDRTAAAKRLRESTGPWDPIPEFEVGARPALYRRTDAAPAWLGLAVITAGVREP